MEIASTNAQNERIKLKATFLNGMAIGFGIAGFFVPIVSLVPQIADFVPWLGAFFGGSAKLDWAEIIRTAFVLLGIMIAWYASWALRRHADKTIQALKD